MRKERRHSKRYPCTHKIGIFLAKGEHGTVESATLTGNLVNISSQGAELSLPQILDNRTHLAYTAMESQELLLHLILYYGADQTITVPTEPVWFNRNLSEPLTPFRLGVKFRQPLQTEQLTPLIKP
jgi:hypothetical protein